MNPSCDSGDHSVIDRVFRDEWSRVVAVLARSFRDLDLAEDAAQQAFAEAATSWPRIGVPDSPGAWITAGPIPTSCGDQRSPHRRCDLCRHRLESDPRLYDHLLEIAATPVVELNRAVALAEVNGPQAALEAIERLDLDEYHLWHAMRADLLRRCGRLDDANLEYERAIDLTDNPAERQLLRRNLNELCTTSTAEERD